MQDVTTVFLEYLRTVREINGYLVSAQRDGALLLALILHDVPKLDPEDDEPLPFELRRYRAKDGRGDRPYSSTWHTIAECYHYKITKSRDEVSGNLFQYFKVPTTVEVV